MRQQHYTSSQNKKRVHNKNKSVAKASISFCKHDDVNLEHVKRKRVVPLVEMNNLCKKRTLPLSVEEESELRAMILLLTIMTTKTDTSTTIQFTT